MTEEEDMERWREQCRGQLKRPTELRLLGGWCYVYKPVLDDAPYRIFNSMRQYRQWCKKSLPRYLGYYDFPATVQSESSPRGGRRLPRRRR